MKWLFFRYSTFAEFEHPVIEHQFLLRCAPQTCARQRVVRADVVINPSTKVLVQKDGFGNVLHTGSITYEHTSFQFRCEGEVFVSPDNRDPSALNPAFRYPSPHTRPSRALEDFLKTIPIAKDVPYRSALAVCSAVSEVIAYTPGATGVTTTAAEAFDKRMGVCQDYAHITLSLLRLAGIPARYVCGLTLGEGATHAWVEVYEEGAWRGVDPTHNRPVSDEYIRISAGRDFSDCPVERGVFQGDAGVQNQLIEVKVTDGALQSQTLNQTQMQTITT